MLAVITFTVFLLAGAGATVEHESEFKDTKNESQIQSTFTTEITDVTTEADDLFHSSIGKSHSVDEVHTQGNTEPSTFFPDKLDLGYAYNNGESPSKSPPSEERVKYIYVTFNGDQTLSSVENLRKVSVANNTEKNQEEEVGRTQVYIIGIVGIIPAAGALLWCFKRTFPWFCKKKHKQSEDSSSDNPKIQESTFKRKEGERVTSSDQNNPDGTTTTETITETGTQNTSLHSLLDDPQWEVPRSNVQLIEVLGEGNFGRVWKAEILHSDPDETRPWLVAVKTVKERSSSKDKKDLLKELQIMQELGRHPNVVTILGCCTEQEPYYVIMEYVVRGKLLSFLRDHRSRRDYYNCSPTSQALTSRDLTMFAYHVARGMEYVSTKGVIHRDLAARNVLVDHNKVCKVADFGLSRSIRDKDSEMYEQKTKGALPVRWMAPESLYLNVFTVKSDVWSFGILLWEIVTLGSTPYPGLGARQVIQEVREGYTMEQPEHCREELYKIMKDCWRADVNNRPSFSDLRTELGRLLELQTGYVDLEHFPEHVYYNLYQSYGEKV
ncbi:tyrosine kinase receptor Cad96Ca-like [Tachypleus tridentatus]|uniref:tyrosine kinase receptor Cad96Ca-like n=1 Tax=Tachypleus tridentatus TaxID=6853 RepID=UPI003FD60BC4